MERTTMPNLRNGSYGGFEPWLTWLRVRRSTTELPRSSLISVSTQPNSRLSTGMYWLWSKRASPYPRVFLLSALFVAAVQYCRRRCAVRRCSNRRIAILNLASNWRWRRLVQTSNETTTRDWRCCRPTKRRNRVCRTDRRKMWTLPCSSRARWISAWPVREIISRVLVYRRWASWRVPRDRDNSRLWVVPPAMQTRDRPQYNNHELRALLSNGHDSDYVSSWWQTWHLCNCWRMWSTRTILPKLPFYFYATVGRTQLDTSCPSVRRSSGVPVRGTYRPFYHSVNRPNDTMHVWVWLVRVNNRKQSFCPVRHVSLFEVSFRFANAYSIADSELRCADAFVTIRSLPHDFMIGNGHFWRSHSDTALIGVVVRSHEGLQDIDVSNWLGFGEITPHTCLQGPIEPLDSARFDFFVVHRKMMHTVLF